MIKTTPAGGVVSNSVKGDCGRKEEDKMATAVAMSPTKENLSVSTSVDVADGGKESSKNMSGKAGGVGPWLIRSSSRDENDDGEAAVAGGETKKDAKNDSNKKETAVPKTPQGKRRTPPNAPAAPPPAAPTSAPPPLKNSPRGKSGKQEIRTINAIPSPIRSRVSLRRSPSPPLLSPQVKAKNIRLAELAELRAKKLTKYIHRQFHTMEERSAALKAAEGAILAQLELKHQQQMAGEGGSGVGGTGGGDLGVLDKMYMQQFQSAQQERKKIREAKERLEKHSYVAPTPVKGGKELDPATRKRRQLPFNLRGSSPLPGAGGGEHTIPMLPLTADVTATPANVPKDGMDKDVVTSDVKVPEKVHCIEETEKALEHAIEVAADDARRLSEDALAKKKVVKYAVTKSGGTDKAGEEVPPPTRDFSPESDHSADHAAGYRDGVKSSDDEEDEELARIHEKQEGSNDNGATTAIAEGAGEAISLKDEDPTPKKKNTQQPAAATTTEQPQDKPVAAAVDVTPADDDHQSATSTPPPLKEIGHILYSPPPLKEIDHILYSPSSRISSLADPAALDDQSIKSAVSAEVDDAVKRAEELARRMAEEVDWWCTTSAGSADDTDDDTLTMTSDGMWSQEDGGGEGSVSKSPRRKSANRRSSRGAGGGRPSMPRQSSRGTNRPRTRWHSYWSDEHQREYYHNPETGEVVWELPRGGEVVMPEENEEDLIDDDDVAEGDEEDDDENSFLGVRTVTSQRSSRTITSQRSSRSRRSSRLQGQEDEEHSVKVMDYTKAGGVAAANKRMTKKVTTSAGDASSAMMMNRQQIGMPAHRSHNFDAFMVDDGEPRMSVRARSMRAKRRKKKRRRIAAAVVAFVLLVLLVKALVNHQRGDSGFGVDLVSKLMGGGGGAVTETADTRVDEAEEEKKRLQKQREEEAEKRKLEEMKEAQKKAEEEAAAAAAAAEELKRLEEEKLKAQKKAEQEAAASLEKLRLEEEKLIAMKKAAAAAEKRRLEEEKLIALKKAEEEEAEKRRLVEEEKDATQNAECLDGTCVGVSEQTLSGAIKRMFMETMTEEPTMAVAKPEWQVKRKRRRWAIVRWLSRRKEPAEGEGERKPRDVYPVEGDGLAKQTYHSRPFYCHIPFAYLVSGKCRRHLKMKPLYDPDSPAFISIQ